MRLRYRNADSADMRRDGGEEDGDGEEEERWRQTRQL